MVTKGSVKSSPSRAKSSSSSSRTVSRSTASSSSSWSTSSSRPQAKKTSAGSSKKTDSFWGSLSSSSESQKAKKEQVTQTKSSRAPDSVKEGSGGIFDGILAWLDTVETSKEEKNTLAKSGTEKKGENIADFRIFKENSAQSVKKNSDIKKNTDHLNADLNIFDKDIEFIENTQILMVTPDFLLDTEAKAAALHAYENVHHQNESQQKRNWLWWLVGTLIVSAVFAIGLEAILPDLKHKIQEGALAGVIWISLSLYWPVKRAKGAVLTGSIITLIGLLSGNLMAGIALGALITGLLHIVVGRKFNFSIIILGGVMIACLIGHDMVFTSKASILEETPDWFLIVSFVLGLLGLVWGEASKQLKTEEKSITTNPPQRGALLEHVNNGVQTSEAAAISNQKKEYEPYYADLKIIASICESLPKDLFVPTQKIGQKTLAILECMNEDVRDVQAGHQFLGRYLPMIRKSLETFSRLAKHKVNEEEFLKAKILTQQVLNNMAAAFTQMHQQLLSNDVDDLVVNLKTLDRLRQSAGFDSFER